MCRRIETPEGGGITRVYLHNTCIVAFTATKVTLYAGEWRTTTTKRHMNQTSLDFDLGFEVFQARKDWRVRFKDRRETRRFVDYVVFDRP